MKTNQEIIAELNSFDKQVLLKGDKGLNLNHLEITKNLLQFGLLAYNDGVVLSHRGRRIASLLLNPPANEVSIHEED